MELTDYWRFIQKWVVLIVAGTLLAFLISYGTIHLHRGHATPSYQGGASVMVHYVVPFGTPNNPTISPRVETTALKQHVYDPATIHMLANRYQIDLGRVSSITATVDPVITRIDVQVIGTNPRSVDAFAYDIATYLADRETATVQQEAHALQSQLQGPLSAARAQWLAALAEYNRVNRQPSTPHTREILPSLLAKETIQRENYVTLLGQSLQIGMTPLAAATVERSQVTAIASRDTSLIKTVLPATVLGFFLMVAIAALLDYLVARQRASQPQPVIEIIRGYWPYNSVPDDGDC